MSLVSLDALLLQNARLSLAIKREYGRLKKDPAAKYFTYVLQLQHGKFYVGNTDNIYTRMLDHKLMTPASSMWVKEYGPVERVVEISKNCCKEDEHYKTLQYMSMFSWENVRGSSYCRLHMFSAPEALKNFARTRDGEFDYMTADEIQGVLDAVDELETMVEL